MQKNREREGMGRIAGKQLRRCRQVAQHRKDVTLSHIAAHVMAHSCTERQECIARLHVHECAYIYIYMCLQRRQNLELQCLLSLGYLGKLKVSVLEETDRALSAQYSALK